MKQELSAARARMKNVHLLLHCFLRAAYAGRARRKTTSPSRVCIVQLAKLGDMVCTTPMFAAIKKNYPGARVTVVGNRINKELLAGHPYVNEYAVWDGTVDAMVQKIRALNPDALCITAPNADAVAAAYLAGVPTIVCPRIEGGDSPYETFSYRLVRRLAVVVPHRMKHYAPREYLRLLEPLGIETDDTKKTLAVSAAAEDKAQKILQKLGVGEEMLVGITPSAGNKIKEWPADHFAAVADYVVERYGARVIVFGGPHDTKEIGDMMRAVGHGERVSTTPALSIEELKALILRMRLFISADTGPIYIAEAFGIPTIDIVGPVDEREQPPQGLHHMVIVPPRGEPELYVMNARTYDKAEARRQAESTNVETVMRAVDTMIH